MLEFLGLFEAVEDLPFVGLRNQRVFLLLFGPAFKVVLQFAATFVRRGNQHLI
jgi:hypothetical protein